MVYRLHRQPTSLNFELRGETTGYRNLSSDGTVDIGLVLPTVGRNQLSTMLLTDLVEREIDPVTIHGYTIALPSNLAMPTQQESYFFIPVEISKPSFRSYYPAAGPYAVETVHARFKVNEMVDAVKNKVSLLELLNGFTFTEGSLSDITIRKGSLQTNLPVNGISFQPLIPVVAPAYDNKLAMMAIAMMEKDGNYFLSDVKKIKSQGRATLSAAPNHMQRGLVVRILRFDRPNGADALIGQESVKMSMILSPTNRSDVSSFIEIAPSPSLRKGSLGLTPPRKINGLTPTATYVVLSRVEVNQSNQYKLERVFPQWEVYATDWPSNIELPEMPNIPMPEGKMRWEALFAGQPTRMVNGPLEAGPDTMEKATHVSRTAIDF